MNWSRIKNPKLQKLISEISEKLISRKEDQKHLDLNRVMTASRMLQISEFRFFKLAYCQWYGHEITDNRLEYIFSDYMFGDIVPHWVRHFTRKVLDLFDQGKLNPEDFNIRCPEATPELKSAGIGYSIILTLVVFLFCFLITGYTPA
jgi:hypothetical protein